MSQYWIGNCPGATCTSAVAVALAKTGLTTAEAAGIASMTTKQFVPFASMTNLTAVKTKLLDRALRLNSTGMYGAVCLPMTVGFKVDFGTVTTQAHTVYTVPTGSLILGWMGKITEATTGPGTATLEFGFLGTGMATTVCVASAVFTLGKIFAPKGGFGTSAGTSVVSQVVPYINTTGAALFSVRLLTTGLTAGKADIYLTYTMMSTGTLSTASSGITEHVCT